MRAFALISLALLAACTPPQPEVSSNAILPTAHGAYLGVETRLLDGDLVNFRVKMSGEASAEQVDGYLRCVAAQYTLIRGYGFARHLRTNVHEEGGLWRGDAVYTISAALPRGLRTIDAEVVAADCAENGIPMV